MIQPDTELAGELVAREIVRLFRRKPDAVLGLATGSSPLPVYRALRAKFEAGEVSFAAGSAFTLDEYVGLPEGHPESYRAVIRTELTDHIDIDIARVNSPNVHAANLDEAAARYEADIRDSGGVDLQLLGIGENGHIGFNEPSGSLNSRTRVASLTASTRIANARFFDGDISQVPTQCMTQGLATIMQAKHLVLLAQGHKKASAVAALIEGGVSAFWPASVLQNHPHVTVLIDDEAAAELKLADYYREIYGAEPSWRPF